MLSVLLYFRRTAPRLEFKMRSVLFLSIFTEAPKAQMALEIEILYYSSKSIMPGIIADAFVIFSNHSRIQAFVCWLDLSISLSDFISLITDLCAQMLGVTGESEEAFGDQRQTISTSSDAVSTELSERINLSLSCTLGCPTSSEGSLSEWELCPPCRIL